MGDMADDARDREEQWQLEYHMHQQGICGGHEDCFWCEQILTNEYWGLDEPVDHRIEVCEMIAEDAKNDAKNFDGRVFNGRVVAEYFGNHGAAIAALADIIKSMLEEK